MLSAATPSRGLPCAPTPETPASHYAHVNVSDLYDQLAGKVPYQLSTQRPFVYDPAVDGEDHATCGASKSVAGFGRPYEQGPWRISVRSRFMGRVF